MIVKFIKLNEEFLEIVRKWRNTPEISKHMYTDHYITKKEHKNWFNKMRNDPTKKYWIINLNNKNVGLVSLFDIDRHNKRCYWAYYLADPSSRGIGLGRLIELNVYTYVFEKLGLNKLCCEVLAQNQLVVKIHQKYGSKIEGIFRMHIYKNKIFNDIVCMGILKEEWEDIRENFTFNIIDFED